MEQVVKLCGQAMLIDEGELLLLGRPELVVRQYQCLVGAESGARPAARKKIRKMHVAEMEAEADTAIPIAVLGDVDIVERYDPELRAENSLAYEPNGALIESVRILKMSGERVNQLLSGQTYRCAFRARFTSGAVNIRFAMLIKTSSNVDLGGAVSAPTPADGIPNIQPGSTVEVEFEFKCVLNPGAYFLNVSIFGCVASVEYALHGIIDAEAFRVVAGPNRLAIAIVDFDCQAKVRMIDTVGP
jgi:lipopolysaccharide transport system ATP-binding protein